MYLFGTGMYLQMFHMLFGTLVSYHLDITVKDKQLCFPVVECTVRSDHGILIVDHYTIPGSDRTLC